MKHQLNVDVDASCQTFPPLCSSDWLFLRLLSLLSTCFKVWTSVEPALTCTTLQPTTTRLPPAWIQPPKLRRSECLRRRQRRKVNTKQKKCQHVFQSIDCHDVTRSRRFHEGSWLNDKNIDTLQCFWGIFSDVLDVLCVFQEIRQQEQMWCFLSIYLGCADF